MDKVLLLGDTHGDEQAISLAAREAKENNCMAIIQLGDFGFGWHQLNNKYICSFSKWVSRVVKESGIPLYWLDGNHENFDLLETLELDGNGHCEYIPGVTYLSRGSTIKFGDTTFMAFGGAYSVDKATRIPHRSWWPQETCTLDDLDKARNAGKVDIFLSHDAPYGTQDLNSLENKLHFNWGIDAFPLSIANQSIVRAALDVSEAKYAYHGHIHQYTENWLDTGTEDGVHVTSLNCNGNPRNTKIITV